MVSASFCSSTSMVTDLPSTAIPEPMSTIFPGIVLLLGMVWINDYSTGFSKSSASCRVVRPP